MSSSAASLVEQWVRPEIRAMSAYGVADAGGCIKLDAMENPYGWPPELIQDWLDRLRAAPLNRYPDPQADTLTQALRGVMDIPDTAGVLLGNGSDELIQLLALAVSGAGRAILAPEPGFVMYSLIARIVGMEFIGVPLNERDFCLDGEAMLAAIDRHQPALTFLAYPNNPTGNLFDRGLIEEILQVSEGMVVVDEAYAPFALESFLPRLADFPNLLVMRTLSKLGLAGLRVGLLAGSPQWIAQLDKLRLPYNINTLSQVSAVFALEHHAVLDRQAHWIRRDRADLLGGLAAIEGIHAYPSDANFILFRVTHADAGRVHEGLRRAGILIKCLDGSHPLLQGCLRVSVGRPEQNALFLETLARLLSA